MSAKYLPYHIIPVVTSGELISYYIRIGITVGLRIVMHTYQHFIFLKSIQCNPPVPTPKVRTATASKPNNYKSKKRGIGFRLCIFLLFTLDSLRRREMESRR